MKDDLFLSDTQEKTAVRSILSGLGVICAALTVLVFSTLFFSDITLSVKGALDFSVDFALLFFSSYVMYFSLFDTGSEKAASLASYTALKEKRAALFLRYRAKGSHESLTAFCRRLSFAKTEERRQDVLSLYFLSEEEATLLRKKDKKDLTKNERRALWRLSRLKPVRITPALLLAERALAKDSTPFSHSPEQLRRRRFFRFLLPSALTAFFSVALVCEVIRDPSLDVIVGYLLKLFTLLFNGVKGFRSGYAYVDSDKNAYMHEQCFWLEEYFASLEREKTSNIPPPATTSER